MERVVITGAAGAIGGVVVERFLQEDLEVIGVDVDVEGDGLHRDDETDSLHWLAADLTKPDTVREAVDLIWRDLGPIDSLVHLAGGFRFHEIGDATDEDLDFLLDVNLRSSIYLLRETIPRMKESDFGRVVLTSSIATLAPDAGVGPYAATKAGLNALVSSVSKEVKDFDININAIAPSVVDTPANRSAMPDADQDAWVNRGDIAEIVYALTQPTHRAIHGAIIPIAGRV